MCGGRLVLVLLGAGAQPAQCLLGRGGKGDQSAEAAQHASLIAIVRRTVVDPEDLGALEDRPVGVGPVQCSLAVGRGNFDLPVRMLLRKLHCCPVPHRRRAQT
jgi:hypothetical protein